MNDYSIYQLRAEGAGNELFGLRFEQVTKLGATITPDNYERVYKSPSHTTKDRNILLLLQGIYERFQSAEPPAHYTGDGINVSDIVTIEQDGVLTAYYWDEQHWVRVPEFAQALTERIDLSKRGKAILQAMESDNVAFRMGENSYISVNETDNGYNYHFYRPVDQTTLDGSISFSELQDLSEEFPDYALFYLLTKGICDTLGIEREGLTFTPMNTDNEKNFSIVPVEQGYQVYSDSPRFGENALVFQAPDRDACMRYIADRRIEGTPWSFYIIPDMMTWVKSTPDRETSPIEHYQTVEEAIQRFQQLRQEPFNNEQTLNQHTGRPYVRLTLGIERSYPPVATDILHVMAGYHKLVTDFRVNKQLSTSAEALGAIERIEKEIGFDAMSLTRAVGKQYSVDEPLYQPLSVQELLGVVHDERLIVIPAEQISKEQEVLYDLDNHTYLHLQLTEEGFDYTFYNKATEQEQGQGFLNLDDLPAGTMTNVESAKNAILDTHDLKPEQIKKRPLTKVADLYDANPLDEEAESSFLALLEAGISAADSYNAKRATPPQQGVTR